MRSEPLPLASPQLTRETFSPDLLDQAVSLLPSPNSQRSYRRGMEAFLAFAGNRPITRALVYRWRDAMARKLTPSSVNTRIAAIRKLFHEAARLGVIARPQALDLADVAPLRKLGQPTGNWLTREQCRAILANPNRRTLKGKRNYCVLAILLGCGLRRSELADLQLEQVQMREGRWVLADLRGKGRRVRTVAVPAWVKEAIDGWAKASAITSGRLIRRTTIAAEGLSTNAIWRIVQQHAAAIGVPSFSPHDLRRTCAKLCRAKGGRIEQIQAMLGHSSIATTERYLGTIQDLKPAVNDDLGIWAA
jgi:integrase